MEKEQMLECIKGRKPQEIIYVLCKVLKSLGVDPGKLVDVIDELPVPIPDERPVPVIVGDLQKLCGETIDGRDGKNE